MDFAKRHNSDDFGTADDNSNAEHPHAVAQNEVQITIAPQITLVKILLVKIRLGSKQVKWQIKILIDLIV